MLTFTHCGYTAIITKTLSFTDHLRLPAWMFQLIDVLWFLSVWVNCSAFVMITVDAIDCSGSLYSTESILCRTWRAIPRRGTVGISYNIFYWMIQPNTISGQALKYLHTHATHRLTDTSSHGDQLIILVLHDSLKVLIRFFYPPRLVLLLHTDSICASAHSVCFNSQWTSSVHSVCAQFSTRDSKSCCKTLSHTRQDLE